MRPLSLSLLGLTASLEEGYFDAEMASNWGLAQLEILPAAPWLSDLVCCRDVKEALEALYSGIHAVDAFSDCPDHDSLRLGFAYLMYSSGRRSVREILPHAVALAGHIDEDSEECSTLHSLMGKVDGAQRRGFTERLENVFAPHARLAGRVEEEILEAVRSQV